MNIDTRDKIAGQPILEIRKLLKRGMNKSWNEYLAQRILNVNLRDSIEIIKELKNQCLIEKSDEFRDFENAKNKDYWKNTLKGNALAMARAKTIYRRTAEKKLAEFLVRVKKLKDDDGFLYKVGKVLVFGSYLDNSKERLGDLDIAVSILPKEKFRKKLEMIEKRFEGTLNFNEIEKPLLDVIRLLKSCSRIISLHPISDGILLQTEFKEVYFDNEQIAWEYQHMTESWGGYKFKKPNIKVEKI